MIHSEQLENYFREAITTSNRNGSLGQLVVAFSGGVDSSVVAAAAQRYVETNKDATAVAVTAISPSVASWQRELARRVAQEIGIEHREVQTEEVENEAYRRNDSRRCYYCKQTLYSSLQAMARDGKSIVLSGTNADDVGDYRPGLLAGSEANVRTPLADLGIDKQAVRRLARQYGLSNAELPASPCLSSRIAYGVSVTPERLHMIDQAETVLRGLGFETLRVRLHDEELARIEVPVSQIPELLERVRQSDIVGCFRSLGFQRVTVDLEGFRSGNLNEALSDTTVVPWEMVTS